MTTSNIPAGRTDVDQVLKEFDGKKNMLADLAETTKGLIDKILYAERVRCQPIQARMKSRDKLKEKYSDPQRDYTGLDDITDQVALRVITYYEDEVDQVANIVKREFTVDPRNSVDKRETEPEKFGYYALNYVCKYSDSRTAHIEYRKFHGMWFEIQIVSILRHAWAEIEHPWYDLKKEFPHVIKRRFARMAALLEIAEQEFLDLRKLQSDYRQSIAVQVEANVYDLPVDSVSIGSFIKKDSLAAELDLAISKLRGLTLSSELSDRFAERRSKAAILAGMSKLRDVREALAKYKDAILEYERRIALEAPTRRAREFQQPGIAVQLLSNILVEIQGLEPALKYFEALKIQPDSKLAKRAEIAKRS